MQKITPDKDSNKKQTGKTRNNTRITRFSELRNKKLGNNNKRTKKSKPHVNSTRKLRTMTISANIRKIYLGNLGIVLVPKNTFFSVVVVLIFN